MSETIFLLTIALPLATVLLVFGMKYFSAVQQARARLANDEAYRRVAEQAATAQAASARALISIDATLSDLKTRLVQVEQILKQVE